MWRALAWICLAGCGRLEFDPIVDAGPACTPWQGSWTAEPPVLLYDDTGYQHSPSLSPDCLTLYYARGGDIRQRSRPALDQPFGAESLIVELSNGAVADFMVALVEPEGLEAFVSRIDGIYRATRAMPTAPFTIAEAIGHSGIDVNVSGDGLRLYFEYLMDIRVAERSAIGMPFGVSSIVPGLDTPEWEHGAYLTPDELLAITGRAVDGSDLDLWLLTRTDRSAPFTAATRLDPLNEVGITESHAWMCTQTCELFYISELVTSESRIMKTRLVPL